VFEVSRQSLYRISVSFSIAWLRKSHLCYSAQPLIPGKSHIRVQMQDPENSILLFHPPSLDPRPFLSRRSRIPLPHAS